MITHTEARARLERELLRQISTLCSADDAVAGWVGDRASDGIRRPWETSDGLEMTGRLRDLGAGRARALQLALVRVDKGTYGTCTQCGGRISRERLDLMPEADVCRTCAN